MGVIPDGVRSFMLYLSLPHRPLIRQAQGEKEQGYSSVKRANSP